MADNGYGGRPALVLGVRTAYILLQLRSGDQLVHPLQKDFAAGLPLIVLVFGFGEIDEIHGCTEPYAVVDSRIIADGSDLFRVSLAIDSSGVRRTRLGECVTITYGPCR